MSKFKELLFNSFIAVVAIFILFVLASPIVLMCDHNNLYGVRLSEKTCVVDANVNVVCLDCGKLIENRSYEASGHDFGNYKIAYGPNACGDGLEIRTCKNCGFQEGRLYSCKHELSFSHTPKESTCAVLGVEIFMCNDCNIVTGEKILPLLEHNYGDWEILRYATPLENGEKERCCSECNKKEAESYSMSMAGSNSIYIPGTGIDNRLTATTLTQYSVDGYDMVLDYDYYGSIGTWILGHNYGTLSKLPNVSVGQPIYIAVDGNIHLYQVTVSEYAMLNSRRTDIIGTSSGISVLSSPYGYNTLHIYTCYGGGNGRWMVLAKKIL